MTESNGNTKNVPSDVTETHPTPPAVETHPDQSDVEVLTTMVEEQEPKPGYTLIPVEDDEEYDDDHTPFFTPGVVAWLLAIIFGTIAPFGSVALLDLFPGLVEGLIRLDRNLLAGVDLVLLGVVIAAVIFTWAVVISCLAVCIGKRPGFWTGSALTVFLVSPPAILLGIPMLSLFFN